MKIGEYINKELFSFKPLSSQPYLDNREPVESRIYRILTRSAFRSGPIAPEVSELIKSHINTAVSESKPIRIVYAFGGGRGVETNDHPHVSWPEFFHIKFLYENLYPILEIYEPGLRIDWSSDDYAAMIINNYKSEWIDLYSAEFPELLNFFKQLTLPNFTQTYKPSSDWYEFEDLNKRVQEKADEFSQDTTFVEETYQKWLPRAVRNIYTENEVSEDEMIKLAKRSTLLNLAWLDVDFGNPERGEYFSNGIPVAHFSDFVGTLLIRTVTDSTIQQWKANAYLNVSDSSISPKVVSREQWSQIKDQLSFRKIKAPIKIKSFEKIGVLGR